jgi:hypothetical protein
MLTAAASSDPAALPFLDALAAIDVCEGEGRFGGGTTIYPALHHLYRAMAQLRCDAVYVEAIRYVVPHLVWGGGYQVSGPVAVVAWQLGFVDKG